jgi:hypothetical protein
VSETDRPKILGEEVVWVCPGQMHKLSVPIRGEPPHHLTVLKYVREGRLSRVNGHVIRLEAVQEMDSVYTSAEAWQRLHERLNDLGYQCPGCRECEEPQ